MTGYNSTLGDGDKAKEWIKFRNNWIKKHPPQDNGCYLCGICGRWCRADEVELDHIISRSRRPDLVFDEDNIQPAHHWCNTKKSSLYSKPVVSKDVYNFLEWLSSI